MLAPKSRRASYSVVKVRGAIPGCHRTTHRQLASIHLPAEDTSRRNQRRFEEIALGYLAEHEDAEGLVRFDIISIGIVADHRALLRCHRGAFNACM